MATRCSSSAASTSRSGRLVEHLRSVAHPVVTRRPTTRRVAAISANDDDMVGAVLAEALYTVGDAGIVTVEESPTSTG